MRRLVSATLVAVAALAGSLAGAPGAIQADVGVGPQGAVPIELVDLALTKTADSDTVRPGELIVYTITVTNVSDEPAFSVLVEDLTPVGTTFVAIDVDDPWFDDPLTPLPGETGFVEVQLIELAPQESASFTLTVRVDADAEGDIVNSATVSTKSTDIDASNNTSEATTQIAEVIGLGIDKSAPSTIDGGELLTYTIEAFNAGPDEATGTTVVDTLPENVLHVSNTCGAAPPVDGILTWEIGTLAAGEAVTCEVTVQTANAPEILVNSATVSSDQPDPDESDNTDAVRTRVIAPELTIDKIGPDVGPPGSTLTYAIVVTNTGTVPTSDAGISIVDEVIGGTPAGFEAPEGVECIQDGDFLDCVLAGPFAPGAELVIWAMVTAPETAGTTGVLNVACVVVNPWNLDLDPIVCDQVGTSIVADVPVPPLPPVGPNLYQAPPDDGTPTATEPPTETPTAAPTVTETPAPEPTATSEPTATAEPSPTPTAEPTEEPTATSEPTATAAPPTAAPTVAPTQVAPMPPDTGSGGVSGGSSTIWLALGGFVLAMIGAASIGLRRVAVHR